MPRRKKLKGEREKRKVRKHKENKYRNIKLMKGKPKVKSI